MDTQESLREIENLRLRFRMNNRLRLESLAALSKIFREHGEPLRDELLASLVFAVPEELNGGNGRTHGARQTQDGQYAASDFPPPEVPPGGFPPPTGFPPPEGLPGEVPPDSPESPVNVPPPTDFPPPDVPPPDVPPPTGFPPPDVPPAASAGKR